VSAGEGAKELAVTASFPSGSEVELGVDDGAERFVRDVAVIDGDRRETVAPSDASWTVLSCRTKGCRLRYRFLLAEASAALDDPDVAQAHGDVFVAPPSTWLLRPLMDRAERTFRFRVETPKDIAFATGVFPDASGPHSYRATVGDLPMTPYSAFGKLHEVATDVGGRSIDIALAPGSFSVGENKVLDWIHASAEVVAKYYGLYPVPRVLLIVLPRDGSGLGFAKTLGNGGASIVLPVGRATSERGLYDDWMLVHEMIHLAFPSIPRRYIWLEEGIATYVEPFARARAGRLAADVVWSGLLRGLPHGLPESGDRGLDNTHTWGRTYWGGALFCFLADVEIRERTQNRRSLDDALRAILSAGGNISVRWELERAFEVGDRATGVPVLAELHAKMGSRAYPVDLDVLKKKLGVAMRGSKVAFDDAAPLAEIRRSMTAER
jgi:predicted metalloprotease with PDZ domain